MFNKSNEIIPAFLSLLTFMVANIFALLFALKIFDCSFETTDLFSKKGSLFFLTNLFLLCVLFTFLCILFFKKNPVWKNIRMSSLLKLDKSFLTISTVLLASMSSFYTGVIPDKTNVEIDLFTFNLTTWTLIFGLTAFVLNFYYFLFYEISDKKE